MSTLTLAARTSPAAALLTVDLEAVAANTRHFVGRSDAAIMAVVKADGFGHGAVEMARTALDNGAAWLGVTSIDEALQLRAAGLRAPTLSWLNAVDADWSAAVDAGIDLAVSSRQHLDAVGAAGGRARVHLQLDTGMARDGAEPSAWAELCRAARLAELAGRIDVAGVMGHLGCAAEAGDPCNALGRRRFAWGLQVARGLGLRPRWRHLAATASTLTDPRSHYDLCRIGAGLVGIDPSHTTRLHGAMTLSAPVVSVRRVRAGTLVGYGHTWTASAATCLALLPVGYADGLPRITSGRAEVQVRGRRRRLVGTISMDQAVLDLGDAPVPCGEPVTIFGPGDHGEPTVADWATWAGTIEHEIVTGIGRRVRRSLRPARSRGPS